MAGLRSALFVNTKGSTFGWTVRANSSNTRCWYCISVTNLAAWNRRSPSHCSAATSAAVVGKVVRSTLSHSLMKARSPEARMVCLLASTRRLCSEWKMVWTAVRPMFSLPRPSPVMK